MDTRHCCTASLVTSDLVREVGSRPKGCMTFSAWLDLPARDPILARSESFGFLKISMKDSSSCSVWAIATRRIEEIESPPRRTKLSSIPTAEDGRLSTEQTALWIFFSASVVGFFLFAMLVSRYIAIVSRLRFCIKLRRRLRSSLPAEVQGNFVTGMKMAGIMYEGSEPARPFSVFLHMSRRSSLSGRSKSSAAGKSVETGCTVCSPSTG